MSKFIKSSTVKKGFENALAGLKWAFTNQMNFRIHLLVTFLTVFMGFCFKISYMEWLVLLTAFYSVIALELVNTSIEQATDAITREFNPIIKKAKDTSAAAVLIYAFYAVLIGFIIFGPKILTLLNS